MNNVEKEYFTRLTDIINTIPVMKNVICLEGASASGKTTVASLLKNNNNFHCLLGIPDEMNSFEIKKKMICNASRLSSAMYFWAGNIEIAHKVKMVIGHVVLDRFFLSTFAVNYKQCQDPNNLMEYNRKILDVFDNIKEELICPNIFFVLKVDKERCLTRIESKIADESFFDRREVYALEKENAFWEHLKKFYKNIYIIETNNFKPEMIAEKIYNEINNFQS